MSRWFFVLVLLTFLGSLFGRKAWNRPTDSRSPVPAVADFGAPATEHEVMQFGLQLEAAVVEQDRAALSRLIPWVEIHKRAVSDFGLNGPADADAIDRRHADRMLDIVREGGSFRLLRVHEVNGRPQALFRSIHGKGGLNYLDVTLVRATDGTVVVDDIFPLIEGESVKQGTRRKMIAGLNKDERRFVTGTEALYAQHCDEAIEFANLVQDGRGKEAMAIYRRWPIELQRDRYLELVAVLAAEQMSDALYVRQIEEFQQDHPNDPCGDLIALDALVLKGQFPQAVKALDRIKKWVGGDPYLDVLQAMTLARMGRFPDAKAAFRRAAKEEPTLNDLHRARQLIQKLGGGRVD